MKLHALTTIRFWFEVCMCMAASDDNSLKYTLSLIKSNKSWADVDLFWFSALHETWRDKYNHRSIQIPHILSNSEIDFFWIACRGETNFRKMARVPEAKRIRASCLNCDFNISIPFSLEATALYRIHDLAFAHRNATRHARHSKKKRSGGHRFFKLVLWEAYFKSAFDFIIKTQSERKAKFNFCIK